MKYNFKYLGLILPLFILGFGSCKKEWLEKKQDKSLVIPSTLEDLQALLDNNFVMNSFSPVLGEIGADNFFFPDNFITTLYKIERNAYSWLPDIFEGDPVDDWSKQYQKIYYSNLCIEECNKINRIFDNEQAWNNVMGNALFFRSLGIYNIAQLFCKPYSVTSAHTDLGVILRLSSDIREQVERSSVQETYDRIITDLKAACQLLPTEQLIRKYFRATRQASYALLSRVYLSMSQFEESKKYADSCLQITSSLIDFNQLNALNQNGPIPILNEETLFFSTLTVYTGILLRAKADTILLNQYHSDDLRKRIYFNLTANPVTWKGNYTGSRFQFFGGLATDEVFLNRAECYARLGQVTLAMEDLNTLLKSRWLNSVPFPTYTATDANDALQQILTERRKELLMRGLRWTDLRRLNQEPGFASVLSRKINGQTITLPENDAKYVLPIPQDEILYNNVPQNIR